MEQEKVSIVVFLFLFMVVSAIASAESYWIYSARWEGDNVPSDGKLQLLVKEQGSMEYVEFGEDSIIRRSIVQFGKKGVGFPGFTSVNRALLEKYFDKTEKVFSGDGSRNFRLQLDGVLFEWSIVQTKGNEGLSEVKCYLKNNLLYIEQRKEIYTEDGVRPFLIRWDYQKEGKSGVIVQLFEPCSGVKSANGSEYVVSGGVEEIIKVDAKGDIGKAVETQPVQFTAPMKGVNLSFDSGWWPNGKGEGGFEEEPGGFPVQVRIRSAAVANYQADVLGFFHLSPPWLKAGNASGFWGYDFGAELLMKAGFDIGLIPPFVVDVPYIPDVHFRTTAYDYFDSFLLDNASVIQDDTPRTHLFEVDLVNAILNLVGVSLPSWLKWIPFEAGAGVDASANANGSLECDTISLSEGLLVWEEGQIIPVEVGENGYRTIMSYNEICNLVLTVKFYPTVFISIFGGRWDLPIMTIPWSPFNGPLDLEFRPYEANFTSGPPSQPATDWFTEDFTVNNDLDFKRLLLTPVNSANGYFACTSSITGYPVDSILSTVVNLGDDAYVEVPLANGKQVVLYGVSYDRVYIGSNGYLTFTEGDTQNKESPENHFRLPRVSGMFDNLKPNEGGQIWWKQLEDRFVVTYDNVRVDGNFTNDTVSFQIEMFFDGRIAINWLNIEAYDGLSGISAGNGVPEGFTESDLSRYAPCADPEGTIEGIPEGVIEGEGIVEGLFEGSAEGVIEGEGEIPEGCPKPCAISLCGNTAIQSNARSAWEAYCSMKGIGSVSADLDGNQMIELAQLQLLDIILANPGVRNRCCVLSAWQSNYATFTTIIDTAISQGRIPQNVLSVMNASQIKALFAGIATLGEVPTLSMLTQIASQIGIIYTVGQVDTSASQYLGAYGDADGDRVCNLAEYNATFNGSSESIITFVVSAVDPSARSNGGGCGAPCYSETNEGEILPIYQLSVVTEGNQAPVSVRVLPVSSGDLNPGNYYLGTNITAQANYDSSKDVWQGWMINGEFVGLSNPISFSISRNTVLKAMFLPVVPEGGQEGEGTLVVPVIQPFVLDLGVVNSGDCVEGTFTVMNSELSISALQGNAVISAPELSEEVFQIISGSSYNLAPGASQSVVVKFCANGLASGEYLAIVSFTGGPNMLVYPVIVNVISNEGSGEGLPEGGIEGTVEGAEEGEFPSRHSADINMNWKIELRELLRVIQFFNSWGYHCANNPGDTEDGYQVGSGSNRTCAYHTSDYNPKNWKIDFPELLRLIQLFNAGGYHINPGGEDGFGVGLLN